MIKATVTGGKVECMVSGRGYEILSEMVFLVDSIFDRMASGEDEDGFKKMAVNEFCELLNGFNEEKEK